MQAPLLAAARSHRWFSRGPQLGRAPAQLDPLRLPALRSSDAGAEIAGVGTLSSLQTAFELPSVRICAACTTASSYGLVSSAPPFFC